MAIERLQREAAIVQRLDVIRGERQCLVVSGNRFCVATQVEQAYTAVVMRRRTDGRRRRLGFKIGDGLLVPSEAGQSEAAIEPRLGMTREQRQDFVEGGKCVLRTSQRQQRVSALIERISIARLQA